MLLVSLAAGKRGSQISDLRHIDAHEATVPVRISKAEAFHLMSMMLYGFESFTSSWVLKSMAALGSLGFQGIGADGTEIL